MLRTVDSDMRVLRVQWRSDHVHLESDLPVSDVVLLIISKVKGRADDIWLASTVAVRYRRLKSTEACALALTGLKHF